jgi:hypothetical protein
MSKRIIDNKAAELSQDATLLLRAIVENGVDKINYNSPKKTLGRLVPEGFELQSPLEELAKSGVNVLRSRVTFSLPLIGEWARYDVDLDAARQLYAKYCHDYQKDAQ